MLVGNNWEMYIPKFNEQVGQPDFARSPRAFGVGLIWRNAARLYRTIGVIGMVNMLAGITMDRSSGESNNLRSHVVLRCVATAHAFGNDCARARQDSSGIRS